MERIKKIIQKAFCWLGYHYPVIDTTDIANHKCLSCGYEFYYNPYLSS